MCLRAKDADLQRLLTWADSDRHCSRVTPRSRSFALVISEPAIFMIDDVNNEMKSSQLSLLKDYTLIYSQSSKIRSVLVRKAPDYLNKTIDHECRTLECFIA